MTEGRLTIDATSLAETLQGTWKLTTDTLRSVHLVLYGEQGVSGEIPGFKYNEDRPVSNPGRS